MVNYMLVSVKTNKLENSENGIKGLATVSFGDAFKVQSISIMEGKNGLFVAMPSYKSKQVDENGAPVYKDICNPITKDFRDQLYGAILSSFKNDRESVIGEADGRTAPKFGVKITPLQNAGNTVGIARIYLEDAFVISNVAVKKTQDGKYFAAMPSFKTSQLDEEGKPVYKDICYPATKEFRKELQSAVINTYLETIVGVNQPVPTRPENQEATPQNPDDFVNIDEAMGDMEFPFDDGFQEPESKPETAKEDAKAKEAKAEKREKDTSKSDKPKSIKDKLADGESKKKADVAKAADAPKMPKAKKAEIA